MYPATLDASAFTPTVFSARRLPDRIHYRIVRCRGCGLVRSDPVVDQTLIRELYARSTFDYADEVGGLRITYGRSLARLARHGAGKDALLEIGGGNGFFLEEAVKQGYRQVTGVEPSQDAIDRASPSVRPHLIRDVIRPGLFDESSFDVVCVFHVFDHLPDPGATLDECYRLLRPGGLFLCVCHDVAAPSSRLLGERSPIVDVEHTYLYSQATASRIFRQHGFEIAAVGALWNVYPVSYLVRLLPVPSRLKIVSLGALKTTGIGKLHVVLPLGNLELVARKPAMASGFNMA
jgi:SAM-dependent methyltransferase